VFREPTGLRKPSVCEKNAEEHFNYEGALMCLGLPGYDAVQAADCCQLFNEDFSFLIQGR
jgi:hypothetical protein